MPEEIKDGKMDVMGINIDISQILGQKIIDQYLAQLKQEDMEKIINYIQSDIFDKNEYNGNLSIKVNNINPYANYNNFNKTLCEKVKDIFNKKFSDVIEAKCTELISTDEYKNKAEEIAKEIINYATEGYKLDIEERIRERLVGNIIDAGPVRYNGLTLTEIIHQEIYNFIGNR